MARGKRMHPRKPRKSKAMLDVVTRQHAHPDTVLHCLYGFYCLGYSRKELSRIYNKALRTIGNWIKFYEATGTYERVRTSVPLKFTAEQRRWLVDFYERRPLAYLDEAKAAFKKQFHTDISVPTVWRIIHDYGLTWKVLERRAMHVKEADIYRFMEELASIDWCHANLVFLDEVSFDNRGMIRKRGYALKGRALAIRGDFSRKPRVSVLAFINVHGVIDFYHTEGTFDRLEFVRCCRDFTYSTRGGVRQYPGKNSVWILDGATIHRHPEYVHFLRSIGVVPIFLPAYCPFFNPIEFLFGYIKSSFRRHYDETSGRDLLPFVAETFKRFHRYDMRAVFEHCGWKIRGAFDPTGPLSRTAHHIPEIEQAETERDAVAQDTIANLDESCLDE